MDHSLARPRRGRRWIALAAGAALALGAGWVALRPVVERWLRAERAVDGATLRLARVVVGDIDRDVAAQGRVVAALHPTLFSPAQGIVTLSVKAGTAARRGQLLATVDSPALASRLAQERVALSALEAEEGRHQNAVRQARVKAGQTIDVLVVRHEAAGRALRRVRDLGGRGVVPASDVEKAADDHRIAALELDHARRTAALEREAHAFETRARRLAAERQGEVVRELARQIAGLRIEAPFDGLVAAVSVQDRDAVAENQPIVTVVNLDALEVELELPENAAADVAPGTPAEITYGGRAIPGRVVVIAPEVRDSQVRGTVAFTGAPPAGLRQNERVSVRILLERRRGVLVLPRGPFLEGGAGRFAYVVDRGVAVRRAIQVGVTGVTGVEIAAGLAAGDQVVISDTRPFEGAESVLLQ